MQTETDIHLEIPPALGGETPRRRDVDAKQHLVAQLLHDSGCEGLLVLHAPNFRWLTAGGQPVGLYGRDEVPGLYFSSSQRWLLASATDSPRLFAEELDGLGFMLKEWHWTTSREQMLADLVFGRKVACDQPFRECQYAGTFFASHRRKMTSYEFERMRELGRLVAEAVEATARTFDWGDPEEEVAGHLAHRLLRHGVEPVALQVTGDGRGRAHRRRSFGGENVEHWGCLQATGRKFGLHATAARTVLRHPIEPEVREEFEAALRCRVAHLALTRVGERVAVALDAARAVLRPTRHEHEWRAAPPVCLTGREPSEGVFLPAAQDRWARGWAAVWQERVGAMAVADTYVLGEEGWKMMTPAGDWPIRRAASQGRAFELPDVLLRGE